MLQVTKIEEKLKKHKRSQKEKKIALELCNWLRLEVATIA